MARRIQEVANRRGHVRHAQLHYRVEAGRIRTEEGIRPRGVEHPAGAGLFCLQSTPPSANVSQCLFRLSEVAQFWIGVAVAERLLTQSGDLLASVVFLLPEFDEFVGHGACTGTKRVSGEPYKQ